MTARHTLSTALLLFCLGAIGLVLYVLATSLVNEPFPTNLTGESTVLNLKKILSTPEPLRVQGQEDAGTLTADGTFTATNTQRRQHGLPPLLRNNTLNKAAQLKVEDMFNQQYFEHVSPDGRGPSDVVEAVSYEYITIGENLALGNFESDEALVQAWMDSPGHRANILSNNFRELGIAVGKGEFEGRSTWLAVQTFGTPLSSCPFPDESLLQRFENSGFSTSQIEQELADLDVEVAEQTIVVESLIEEAKALASEGNAEIQKGNENVEKGNNIYQETGSREQAQPYWTEGEQQQAEGAALLKAAEEKQAETQAANNHLNTLKEQYNTLIQQHAVNNSSTKEAAEKYNQQVRTFNECVEQFQ
ncbi:MAG: CAP domain-containing protein [Candidatus Andersenbacteria bacterium]